MKSILVTKKTIVLVALVAVLVSCLAVTVVLSSQSQTAKAYVGWDVNYYKVDGVVPTGADAWTLAAALGVAKDGSVITISAIYTTESNTTVSKNVTFDIETNNYSAIPLITVSSNYTFTIKGSGQFGVALSVNGTLVNNTNVTKNITINTSGKMVMSTSSKASNITLNGGLIGFDGVIPSQTITVAATDFTGVFTSGFSSAGNGTTQQNYFVSSNASKCITLKDGELYLANHNTNGYCSNCGKGCPSHNPTLVKGQPATCVDNGWRDYYFCSGCGQYFSDAAGANWVDLNAWKTGEGMLQASGSHTYVWVSDGENGHHQYCTTCKQTTSVTQHNFEVNKNDTTHWQRCTTVGCNYETAHVEHTWNEQGTWSGWLGSISNGVTVADILKGLSLSVKCSCGATDTLQNAANAGDSFVTDATCQAAGCATINAKLTDKNGVAHTDTRSYTITKLDHQFGGDWSADGANGHYQLCQLCQEEQSPTQSHGELHWVTDDPTEHWQECMTCDYETVHEEHDYGTIYYTDGELGHHQTCTEVGCQHQTETTEHHHTNWADDVQGTHHKRYCTDDCGEVNSHEITWVYTNPENDSNSEGTHLATCVGDGECDVEEYQVHTWGNWTADETSGNHYKECNDCRVQHTEEHDNNLAENQTAQVDAKCARNEYGTAGVKAYSHCSICNTYFDDNGAYIGNGEQLDTWKNTNGKIEPQHDFNDNEVCINCGKLSQQKQEQLEQDIQDANKKVQDRIDELEKKRDEEGGLTPEEEQELKDLKEAQKKLEDAEKKLEDGETNEDIEDALKDLEQAIDDVILDQKKAAAKEEIEKKAKEAQGVIDGLKGLTQKQKDAINGSIQNIADQTATEIDDATSSDEIYGNGGILQKGKDAIQAIVDIEQSKQAAKDEIDRKAKEAQDAIDQRVPEELDEEEAGKLKDAIQKEADRAKGEIDNAENVDDIEDILDKVIGEKNEDGDPNGDDQDEEDRSGGLFDDIVDTPKEDVDLTAKKSEAKDDIDRKAKEAKDRIEALADLTDEQKKALQDEIDRKAKQAKDAIENAKSLEEIEGENGNGGLLGEVLGDIEGLVGLEEKKQQAKDEIKAEGDRAKAAVDKMDSLTQEQKDALKDEIQKRADKAKKELDNAKNLNDVTAKKNSGIRDIQDVVELAEAKNEANKAIDNARDKAKEDVDKRVQDGELTPEQGEDLKGVIDQEADRAKGDVDNTDNPGDIGDILDRVLGEENENGEREGGKFGDLVDTDADDIELEKKKSDAKDEIDRKAEEAKKNVDERVKNGELTPEEGETLKDAIDREADRARDEIDKAESLEDVNNAQQKAENNMGRVADSNDPELEQKKQEAKDDIDRKAEDAKKDVDDKLANGEITEEEAQKRKGEIDKAAKDAKDAIDSSETLDELTDAANKGNQAIGNAATPNVPKIDLEVGLPIIILAVQALVVAVVLIVVKSKK